MSTIILMVGIPASGKSTFIKNAIAKEKVTAVWVSRDEIRKSLLTEGEDYFSHEKEVFENFVKTINNEVQKGTARIYVDATHINAASRRKILNRINKRKKLNLEVVWLRCAPAVAQARNLNRQGFARVPKNTISNMVKLFQEPSYGELYKFNFKTVKIYTN